MESSWLSSALPRYAPSKSPERERQPRWRTSSPMTASMIPPPIVSSFYTSRPSSSTSNPSTSAPATQPWTHRKQRHLESDLQILLDAQAEGLVAGLEPGAVVDDAASTGSSTPTAQSLNLHGSRSPARSTRTKKLSLRGARRGLYTTIRKLALLKAEESAQIEPQLEECNVTVSQIGYWDKRRTGLQDRIQKIEAGDENQKATRLREQADGMQDEINEVETRLADLNKTQRRLRREAEEVENTVQAKLSRYTNNMAMLEKEMQRFLAEDATSRTGNGSGATPHDLKGLDTAIQAWTGVRDDLVKKMDASETEREALEEGAVVWKDVVNEVSTFERKLREDMLAMSKGVSSDKSNDPAHAEASMHDLLALMDETTLRLDSQHNLAETRNWKLLICAIGAELDAFRKGRQVLEAALASAEDNTHKLPLPPFDGASEREEVHASSAMFKDSPDNGFVPGGDRGDEIRDLDHAFGNARRGKGFIDTDTDDDGPDPELLISHQDTDTE